jgi:hypothetical protein
MFRIININNDYTTFMEMTTQAFNEKYSEYLKEGHYGLAIYLPSVIEYLDKKFQELIKVPGFKYSQIKVKFNSSRFYCEPQEIDSHEIEKEIDRLVKEYELTLK